MKNTYTSCAVAAVIALVSSIVLAANSSSEYVPVSWNQLVPAGYDLIELENELLSKYDLESIEPGSEEMELLVAQLEGLKENAPMTQEYDGINIKVPGFIVPLDFDSDEITNFLLVPYYGACIHTPPPPPNQIVFVKLEKGIKLDNLYDPVYVSGLMRVETQESEMGSAGYTVYGHKVDPYE